MDLPSISRIFLRGIFCRVSEQNNDIYNYLPFITGIPMNCRLLNFRVNLNSIFFPNLIASACLSMTKYPLTNKNRLPIVFVIEKQYLIKTGGPKQSTLTRFTKERRKAHEFR